MRGLIPLNLLVPHCPIGKLAQLVADWEDAYGEPWPQKFNYTRPSPNTIQGMVLERFNGKAVHVSKLKIPGLSKLQITKACIHLYGSGKLTRTKTKGEYKKP